MPAPSQLILPSTANGNDHWTEYLLHGEGTNGGTTFTDSSKNATAISRTGTATTSTTQFKLGLTSISIPGGTSALFPTSNAGLVYGTADFTVDFWVYFNSLVSPNVILYDDRPTGTNGFYATIYVDTLSTPTFRYLTNSSNRITGATTIVINTWYHVALSRVSGTTKLFLNGVQEGSSYTDSDNLISGGTSRPLIGISGVDGSGSFNGFIDELRVSKGIGRWSTTFAPPKQPYF